MSRLAVLFAALVLGGCASGYSQFYQQDPGATPELVAQQRVSPAPAVPKLDKSGDAPQEIYAAYARYGYASIGYSSFTSGGSESEQDALKQGAKVGADLVVVVNPAYAGTRSTVIPMTTPTTQTSYSSGSATAYGSGGTVTAFGNATTTTRGTQTTYIPMTVDRYTYGAIYFVKRKFQFGANFRDLEDAERQKLQTNRGVYIQTVVNDSPAFNADVLPGDIILSIGGESVGGQESFSRTIMALKGQSVELAIARGDQRIVKTVKLLD